MLPLRILVQHLNYEGDAALELTHGLWDWADNTNIFPYQCIFSIWSSGTQSTNQLELHLLDIMEAQGQ